jgi:hypothetical protein
LSWFLVLFLAFIFEIFVLIVGFIVLFDETSKEVLEFDQIENTQYFYLGFPRLGRQIVFEGDELFETFLDDRPTVSCRS